VQINLDDQPRKIKSCLRWGSFL